MIIVALVGVRSRHVIRSESRVSTSVETSKVRVVTCAVVILTFDLCSGLGQHRDVTTAVVLVHRRVRRSERRVGVGWGDVW